MLSTPLYVRSPPKITLLDPLSCIEYLTMNVEFPLPYDAGKSKGKLKVQWIPYGTPLPEPYHGEIRRVEWDGWNSDDVIRKLRLKHRRILGLDCHCNKDASHSKRRPHKPTFVQYHSVRLLAGHSDTTHVWVFSVFGCAARQDRVSDDDSDN